MTPPPYSQFFLNANSNIVQLELVTITHPSFSQQYNIVRNAIAGVTVTLETSISQFFQYYPMKITPSGAYNDMDQSMQVSFGDLGELLPFELDRMIPYPNSGTAFYTGALIGAWVDSLGNLVDAPFVIGLGGNFYVPWNAVALQMGINDVFFFDNGGSFAVTINGGSPITVSGFACPWVCTGGLNPAYPYSPTSSSGPVSQGVTAGSLLSISATGTVQISGGSGFYNAFGNPSTSGTFLGSPGSFVAPLPLPGTYIKPTLLYRTYRSDDLSGPISGPFTFDVNNIAFKQEGATLQCTAQRLNVTTTGEVYSFDRFPMLQGFL